MQKPIKMPKVNVNKRNILSATRIITLFFAFALYVLADYIHSKLVGDLITNRAYWSLLIINMVLVLSIMITLRSSRRDKRISTDTYITNIFTQITIGYNLITKKGLLDNLEVYIEKLNQKSKIETYYRNIKNKINNTLKKQDFVLMFTRAKNKEAVKKKFSEQIVELNDKLKTPEVEILEMSFKYTTVSTSKLFSAIDGRVHNEDEFDIDTHEQKDVSKMLGTKASLILLFGAFTGTIIVDFLFGGIGAIYSTLLKLVSLFFASNVSITTADDFVDHNIKTSLQRRMRMLSGFIKEQPILLDEEIKINNEEKEIL